MSGELARRGFRFQDLYLIKRMLNAASESFALSGYGFFSAKPTQAVRFGIEAKTVVVNDCQVPAWDIVLVTSSNREVVEVKSGEISRLDRHAIWRRLRRELSVGSGAVVRPLLVLSPEPADSHQKWSELSFFAVEWSGHAPAAPPQRVGDAKQLLEEALWWLCRAPDDKVGSPPINLQHAVTALSAFSVEFCSLEYLEAMVSDNIEALFPGGFSDQLCNLILGWLNERAVALRPESHLFTLKELLLEMGILQHCLSLAPGTLERWRTIWTEFPQLFQQRACMQFGETGVSVPMGKSQPAIAVRLSEAGDGGLILRGKAGAGKTAVIAQFRQQLEKECQEFFVCAADDVPEPDISDLMRSLRFRRALLRLHNPDGRFWIMIDALDETEGSVQKAWSQQLALLAANTGITVIVTAREFVSPNDRLIRSQFGTWKYVQTEDWPKELVCELVDRFVPGVHLTDKMLSLLVQPMMLDLFRRTFVEAGGALLHGQTGLKTPHSLLAAFWHQRVFDAPRYAHITNLHSRLHRFLGHAARYVGTSSVGELDQEVVQMLMSEGVLMPEGKLHRLVRFRHSLLRDFAFAQSCFAAGSPTQVARRWSELRGGLQRHGTLRAMFDALLTTEAKEDCLGIDLFSLTKAVLNHEKSAATQLAQILRVYEPDPNLDPARWPEPMQSLLPGTFGRDLLAAARLEENGSWAKALKHWPIDAAWLDAEYPGEVWQLTNVLSTKAKADPANKVLRQQACEAARALRGLSEVSRFQPAFEKSDRWLKMHALLSVVPLLPDEATLGWVERELLQPSWTTRAFGLEVLVHLAAVDATRTADIYRRAICLSRVNGRPVLEMARWDQTMQHHAIDWSLAGHDGKRGLIHEHPLEFIPVAIELVEALWHAQAEERRTSSLALDELVKKMRCEVADLQEEVGTLPPADPLEDLVNDSPDWLFWRETFDDDARYCCLAAIHTSAANAAANAPNGFLRHCVPAFRSSRSATVQSILMDVLLANTNSPGFRSVLAACLRDARLYHVSGLRYWIEQSLMTVWAELEAYQRGEILSNITAVRQSPHLNGESRMRCLLGCLPTLDLPPGIRELQPAVSDTNYKHCERPCPDSESSGFELQPSEDHDPSSYLEGWPDDFDPNELKKLLNGTRDLSSGTGPDENLRARVAGVIAAAATLTKALRQHWELLKNTSRSWMWRSLTTALNSHRKFYDTADKANRPPDDLVMTCAEIALAILEEGPGKLTGDMPDGHAWLGCPDSCWVRALELADAALIWPPASDDSELQARFLQTLQGKRI